MGFFFWLASAQIGEKKPHPPGGFGEEPLYPLGFGNKNALNLDTMELKSIL